MGETCPRCSGPLLDVFEMEPAESIADGAEELRICMECGADEAVRLVKTGVVIPAEEWPVDGPHDHLILTEYDS